MNFHLTTRNFFAWMFEKPLVGSRLGESMINLRRRMDHWRPDPEENMDDFLQYIDEQGYTDFRDCPDHALAVLQWAESVKNAELWTDAFVHCVGMNEQLVSSNEFSVCSDILVTENSANGRKAISRSTIALITRSNLEMAVRIDRASVALASFLEDDDVLYNQVRLSDNTLKHMQRFRSFLHSFYVQRHGYWPPHIIQSSSGKVRPLPKHTFLTMYADFRNLYEFLVDSQTDLDDLSEAARSLLDVLKLVDKQRKFEALPHTLPRLPESDFEAGEPRRPSFFSMFGNRKARQAKRTIIATSLTNATNVSDMKVVSSAIVREYALFEREFTLKENDRISATEARMARWTLIYALLQTIISVTNAPIEVRDTEGVDYPLCCQTGGTPPWKFSKPSSTSIATTGTLTAKASAKSSVTTSTATPNSLTAPSQELITPMSDFAVSAQPSPLDLELVAKRRRSESLKSPTPASSFPRSSALKSAVPQTPDTTTPSKTPDSLTPSHSRSTKRSRIPVPTSHTPSVPTTPSYSSSTPPPIPSSSRNTNNPDSINTRSTALSPTTRASTAAIQAPQPLKPMSDILLTHPAYDSSAPATPTTPLTSTVPALVSPPTIGSGNHSEDIDDSATFISIAGSAPTLLSSGGQDSDLETTASPSTRACSERTGAPTPNPPPSPSLYGAISIAASSSDNIHAHGHSHSHVLHRHHPHVSVDADNNDNGSDFEPVPIGMGKRLSNSHTFASNYNKAFIANNSKTAPRKQRHRRYQSSGSVTPSFGPAQSYAPAPAPATGSSGSSYNISTHHQPASPGGNIGNRDAIFGSQRASMKSPSYPSNSTTAPSIDGSDTDSDAHAHARGRGRQRSKSRSRTGNGFSLRAWSKNRSQNRSATNLAGGTGAEYAMDAEEGRGGIKGLLRKSVESLRSNRGGRDEGGTSVGVGYGASYGAPQPSYGASYGGATGASGNANANAGAYGGGGYYEVASYGGGDGGKGGHSDVSTSALATGELGNVTSVYAGTNSNSNSSTVSLRGGDGGGGRGAGQIDEDTPSARRLIWFSRNLLYIRW